MNDTGDSKGPNVPDNRHLQTSNDFHQPKTAFCFVDVRRVFRALLRFMEYVTTTILLRCDFVNIQGVSLVRTFFQRMIRTFGIGPSALGKCKKQCVGKNDRFRTFCHIVPTKETVFLIISQSFLPFLYFTTLFSSCVGTIYYSCFFIFLVFYYKYSTTQHTYSTQQTQYTTTHHTPHTTHNTTHT